MQPSGRVVPSPRRILVVDDEPSVRDLIDSVLQYDGHSVTLASSGSEALALFQESAFDLVVTDYMMPGMTGGQLAAAIKAMAPLCPVLLVTGYGCCTSDLLRAVDATLAKPFQIEALRQTVACLLADAIPIPSATAGRNALRAQSAS